MRAIYKNHIDWILFIFILPILGVGLVTMKSLGGVESDYFFIRQLIWIGISFAVFFIFSFIDWRFLRNGKLLAGFFAIFCFILVVLLLFATAVKGASSWIDLGFFSVEPSDPMKLLLIMVLAKYFSRRHIEIANIKHIFVSGIYAFVPFVLILFQPDFGSAIIIFFIWLGMILASGVSKKHLFIVFFTAAVTFATFWMFIFAPYQKARIRSFIDPLADIQGTGYNAYQSMIAVGSGRLFGKGVGFGTQSRLSFLPEHQTDFIFAAFAEEWGFIGVTLLFLFFGIVIWRILKNAMLGASNFESLFGVGFAIFLMSHFIVHIGMNIGLLPITGTTIPFLSYGGSHMLTVFAGLGVLSGMRRYGRITHHDDTHREFFGL